MYAVPFTAATNADATTRDLVGIPLAGDARPDGDDDGSDSSMSVTSEQGTSGADDLSSHFDRASQDVEKKKQVKIAETEQRHVRVIRVVTFGFIIFSAITVCVIVYLFAKDYDKRDFELNVSTTIVL